MSDYTRVTNFTAKDSLPTGDPEKLVTGQELQVEMDAIAVAIASKPDTADVTTIIQTSIDSGPIGDAIAAGGGGGGSIGGTFATGLFAGGDGSEITTSVNCSCAKAGTGQYIITLTTGGINFPVAAVSVSNEFQSPPPLVSPTPPLVCSVFQEAGVVHLYVFTMAGALTDPQRINVLAVEPT